MRLVDWQRRLVIEQLKLAADTSRLFREHVGLRPNLEYLAEMIPVITISGRAW